MAVVVSHIRVYLDENVPISLYGYLQKRQIAVTTAQREQTRGLADDDQLRYAASKGFVLLTTNMRHFHLWHRQFRAHGWEHGGIITVPQDDHLPQRLHIRSAMLIDWADRFATTRNALFRWTDLQTHLYSGYTLSRFSVEEIDLALGRASSASAP